MTMGGPTRGDDNLNSTDPSLVEWMDRQQRTSAAAMLRSISAVSLEKRRPGFGQVIRPAKGSVLASPALAAYDPDPDYFFHWLRDSAVVIDALRVLIEEGDGGPDAIDLVNDFVRFSLALGALDGRDLLRPGVPRPAVAPDFQQFLRPDSELAAAVGDAVAGETRFNPDGTLDLIKWARPQHDGPALRALAVIRLWRLGAFDDAGVPDAARRLIEADLAFTRGTWSAPSFDIWEEEIGHHYYTRLVQFAALADGAEWLEAMGDAARAEDCRAASREIAGALDGHWDAAAGFYRSRLGVASGGQAKQLDIATILAVNHAGRADGPHSPLDPKAQATLARLESLFAADYPINQAAPPGRGAAMGRYAGDRYYSGGAYYFATLGAAEFYFRLAGAQDDAAAIDALIARGDGFMATVRAYTPRSGELSEQFDRATGAQTSSKELTWSHAALITAVEARRAACRRRPLAAN
jgi:glucoamylase